MSAHYERQDEAAAKVAEMLARPMPDSHDMLGIEGDLDPWDIFPAIYGHYDSDFDKCAIEVLSQLSENGPTRKDLGAQILREMLCVSNLCDYGTAPRVCFPTKAFREVLPALIEKWRAWAVIAWGEGWETK